MKNHPIPPPQRAGPRHPARNFEYWRGPLWGELALLAGLALGSVGCEFHLFTVQVHRDHSDSPPAVGAGAPAATRPAQASDYQTPEEIARETNDELEKIIGTITVP